MSFIVVKMDKMKNIQNFMLNYVLFYHFPEKTCWKKVIQHFNFLSLAAMAVMTMSLRDQTVPKYFVLIGDAPAKSNEILKLKVE